MRQIMYTHCYENMQDSVSFLGWELSRTLGGWWRSSVWLSCAVLRSFPLSGAGPLTGCKKW